MGFISTSEQQDAEPAEGPREHAGTLSWICELENHGLSTNSADGSTALLVFVSPMSTVEIGLLY